MAAHGHPATGTLCPMLDLPLDPSSKVPKHRQIAAALIADIKAGQYQPGERLPGQWDIVNASGVNRSTALKALKVIADAGYAELSIGLGYYVPDRLPPA